MDLTDDDVPGVSKTRHLKYYYYCLTTIASFLPEKKYSSLKKLFLATFGAVICLFAFNLVLRLRINSKEKKTSRQGCS